MTALILVIGVMLGTQPNAQSIAQTSNIFMRVCAIGCVPSIIPLNVARAFTAPKYPEERMRLPRPTPEKSLPKRTDMGIQVDEFPERPGQPECDYFMKTGDCKFKSACRYHHPKSRATKADLCVLSEKGLPLRPGRKICWHYEQYGICKYGRACLFDHPVNHNSSTFPTGSSLETPYDNSGTHAGYGGVSQAITYQPM